MSGTYNRGPGESMKHSSPAAPFSRLLFSFPHTSPTPRLAPGDSNISIRLPITASPFCRGLRLCLAPALLVFHFNSGLSGRAEDVSGSQGGMKTLHPV